MYGKCRVLLRCLWQYSSVTPIFFPHSITTLLVSPLIASTTETTDTMIAGLKALSLVLQSCNELGVSVIKVSCCIFLGFYPVVFRNKFKNQTNTPHNIIFINNKGSLETPDGTRTKCRSPFSWSTTKPKSIWKWWGRKKRTTRPRERKGTRQRRRYWYICLRIILEAIAGFRVQKRI